jgi:hypothetical protein
MQTNFKNVIEGWLDEQDIKILGFWSTQIRDIERELDKGGEFDIDDAISGLDKIQKFPNLKREDIEYIKRNIRK